jgi:hypothetical protein
MLEIERVPVSDHTLEIKDKVIAKLEKELEEVGETCKKIKQDRDNYLNQLLDSRDKLYRSDYQVQNQKKIIEDTKKTLERYEKENKALRELVGLWI